MYNEKDEMNEHNVSAVWIENTEIYPLEFAAKTGLSKLL